MNQINIGAGCVIDTDEIQYSETRDWGDDGQRILVMFKNAQEAILRGDAKDAFDAWAESIGEGDGLGPTDDYWPRCRTCVRFFRDTGLCQKGFPKGEEAFPKCYEAAEGAGEAESLTANGSYLCDSCQRTGDGEHCVRAYDETIPDCYRQKPK